MFREGGGRRKSYHGTALPLLFGFTKSRVLSVEPREETVKVLSFCLEALLRFRRVIVAFGRRCTRQKIMGLMRSSGGAPRKWDAAANLPRPDREVCSIV